MYLYEIIFPISKLLHVSWNNFLFQKYCSLSDKKYRDIFIQCTCGIIIPQIHARKFDVDPLENGHFEK